MLLEFAYTIGRIVSKKSSSYCAKYVSYSSGAVLLTLLNSSDSNSLPGCKVNAVHVRLAAVLSLSR